MKRVLIVDDDRRVRRTLQILIETMGLDSVAAGDASEALEHIHATSFDLVLSDLKMPGASGIDLLADIRAAQPRLPVILVTAFGTIEMAIDAMKKGASDFVLKPFDNDNLKLVIGRAFELERFRVENDYLKQQAGAPWAAEEMFLALPSMRNVAELIRQVAPSSSPVLITGETGTGKELAARCLHAQSKRSGHLFVPLNCAALPADLLEAELFGHSRGAFTGADRERQGKFAIADGGTLFLDEIGDMPLTLQAKLLRVLEDSIVEPLGTNKRVSVDVRVISATNQHLQEAIAAKQFRSDLYFRLNTFEVHLAPLRERGDDIAILSQLLLERSAQPLGKTQMRLTPEALTLLRSYDWPGNVRELRNLIERAAVLAADGPVHDHFFRPMVRLRSDAATTMTASPAPSSDSDSSLSLPEAVDQFERRLILRALNDADDNKAEAARRLGIGERNLWYKLKKYGL